MLEVFVVGAVVVAAEDVSSDVEADLGAALSCTDGSSIPCNGENIQREGEGGSAGGGGCPDEGDPGMVLFLEKYNSVVVNCQ